MKFFWLKQISGIVAEGVVFSNGWCAVRWLSKVRNVESYASIENLEGAYCADGKAIVVWEMK